MLGRLDGLDGCYGHKALVRLTDLPVPEAGIEKYVGVRGVVSAAEHVHPQWFGMVTPS